MVNLSLPQRFWKIFSTTWLWKISMGPLCYHHILAAGKLRSIDSNKTWYYDNAINVRISLDGYGCKIRKVSRCRPKVSNETILATKQEFFFKKVSPVQSWHCTIGFLINTAPLNVYFILHYHLFFREEFFFSNVYISVNTIFECSICFLVENRPSIK